MQNGTPSGLRQRIAASIVAFIAVIVLALGTYNAIALPGCDRCHDRPGFREATAAAPHAKIDCRSCHVPAGPLGSAAFSLRQPLHMFVPITGGAVRDAAAVDDSRCLACHKDVRAGVVASRGLRIDHTSCAAGAACSDCHSGTAHGKSTAWVRAYEMDMCLECHVTTSKTACDLCHEGREAGSRVRSSTFAVTHGPQWRSTHGMGDGATCMVCHQQDDCGGCHGAGVPHGADFVAAHAKDAVSDKAKCSGCHAESFCDSCHGTPMPHSATFKVDHGRTATANRAVCERCHTAADCTNCHAKHVHPGGAIGGARPTSGGGR